MIGLSELRASAWKYACIAASVLAVAGLIAALLFWGRLGHASARADAAEQRAQTAEGRADSLSRALTIEREGARKANEIAAKYEQDKRDAEAAGKRVVDDLRAGNLRLSAKWRACENRVPATGGTPGEPDAAADDRASSAGRIIGAGKSADDQIRRLQEFIRSERK